MKFYITTPQNCQSCRYKLSIYRPCSNLSHKDSFFRLYSEKQYLSQTELKKTNTIRQYVKFNKLLKQANYYFPTFVTSETLNTKEHESKSCI